MSEDGRCRTCGTITNLPPRLTHAEQAKVSITVRNINTALVSLDKAAEIERVARKVVAAYFHPSPTETVSVAITRLRALVQP